MNRLSVVILTKNSEPRIAEAIQSAYLVTTEVIIIDSGSEDATLSIAKKLNAKIICINWNGYGNARNRGASYAANDFILNIDSDEVISDALAKNINAMALDEHTIYGFKRTNFINKKAIRFGEWSGDIVYRCYNKNHTAWSLEDVHENIISHNFTKKIIPGNLLHYTTNSILSYRKKLENYARLSAQKFYRDGKRPTFIKTAFSPIFNFIKNYFFKLGFLDGMEGLQIASAHYRYTKTKYKYLKEFTRGNIK